MSFQIVDEFSLQQKTDALKLTTTKPDSNENNKTIVDKQNITRALEYDHSINPTNSSKILRNSSNEPIGNINRDINGTNITYT